MTHVSAESRSGDQIGTGCAGSASGFRSGTSDNRNAKRKPRANRQDLCGVEIDRLRRGNCQATEQISTLIR